MYFEKVTLNTPPIAHGPFALAEAKQRHTLAFIHRKVEGLQRCSEAQHKGSALGSYLGSIN